MLVITIHLFFLWLLEVNTSSFLFLSLFHPVHHFLHSLLSLSLIFIYVYVDVVVSCPELSSYDLLDLFFIFEPDVFKVLAEGCLFVFLVEVNSVINEFDQVSIQVHSLVFFILCCVIDVLNHVIVLLVV